MANDGVTSQLTLLKDIVLKGRIPKHLAVIPDGNRRYARKKGISLANAYEEGLQKAKEFARWCRELGIRYLTFYSLSLENLQNRSPDELNILFTLMKKYAKELINNKEIHTDQVRVRIVGRLNLLPKDLLEILEDLERVTREYENYHLIFLMAYSGRAEILDAVNKLLTINVSESLRVDEKFFRQFLYLPDVPDPDLVIRTSGEQRISNFLLWYLAYSELYFINKFWPEITMEDLLKAIRDFQQRERRFGR
ncbi:MAG: polyprenyl diphosphate synthase [Candidatus Njordarchaeales archaeon]